MNRQLLIRETIGLGPTWCSRPGWFNTPLQPEADADLTTGALSAEQALSAQEEEPPALELSPSPVTEHSISPAPLPSRVIADPSLSWELLEQTVANCQNCRLGQTRTHTAFGRGNPKARWLLIGEAPGEQEDKQGQPFVGKAGQLLDNMLSAVGLDRDQDVYIANVLKCRPPGNRNPSQDEIAACHNYLTQQIQHIQPTLILALGRFAAQTLLQTEKSIGQLRAHLHEYQQIPLIVSYHPAYLLRNQPDKYKAWQDLIFAKHTFNRLTTAQKN
ncbi:uracil-DNA glycosylase [Neisseriaceae bacterium TC5R-5]|nr:uracil-DNA glycosylase [Neisseriaceae bacterium TC5R-5]